MRTSVDIPDTQIRQLDEIAREEERSRAALIRDAVSDFLAKRAALRGNDAFGLWGDVDGVAYEVRLRREW